MFLKYNLNSIIDYIVEKKKIEISGDIKEKINSHFLKISFFVKAALIFSFAILNIFSLIFYVKVFYKIANKNKENIIKKSSFLFNFVISKSLEVIHALICIHAYNDEEIAICKRDKNYKSFYEFVVIGSGPGGSITANILNKNFPNRTLLLEKGEEFSKSNSKHSGNEFKHKWQNGGISSSLYPFQINFSSGSCLGGGSEINSGLYHEPDRVFINTWKESYQTVNFDFENIEKYSQKIKDYLKPSIVKQNNLFEKKFESGAVNTKNDFQYIPRLSYRGQNTLSESTMLNTFLKDYENQKGEILTGVMIDKLKQNENGWSIEGSLDKKKFSVKCKYVFLCCGSIYTNSLLLKSLNFKNKNSIKKFNFHPMLKVIAKYPEKIQKINEDVSSLQISSDFPDFIIGNAASSKQFMLASVYDNENIYFDVQKNWEYMTTFHVTYSFGAGQILKIPFIEENIYLYNINNSKLELITRSLNKLCNFVFHTGATEIIFTSTKNKKILKKDNYIEAISSFKKIKDFVFSSVHILGGVSMGEKNECTTDSFGKIKEHKNIYINDSSLINNKLLKNPQGTVMSIAYRNIENFVKNYKNNL